MLPFAAEAQQGFVLIVNLANPVVEIRREDASKLFLRKRTRWPNGEPVLAVDQVESSPVRRRFSNGVHRMDVPSVKGFWQEIVFSGKGDPPPERVADADVIAFVKATPNALGYVSVTTSLDGVKPVLVVP